MKQLPPDAIVFQFKKETDKETGARLKQFREGCGVSQQKLAEEILDTVSNISKVENGHKKATTVFMIKYHRACVRLANDSGAERKTK